MNNTELRVVMNIVLEHANAKNPILDIMAYARDKKYANSLKIEPRITNDEYLTFFITGQVLAFMDLLHWLKYKITKKDYIKDILFVSY